MWGRKRRAFYAVDPVNPDAMQDGGKPHFLDKFKAVVDDVLGRGVDEGIIGALSRHCRIRR